MTAADCVYLIGGTSGTGKTSLAAEIGLQFGIPWFQVDDLRLAMQRCRVTLPEHSEELYFFADIDGKSDIWKQDPTVLRSALIAVGEILSPGIEAVIENHIDQRQPIIIEGDGILPSLFARPAIQERFAKDQVRAIFLVESDEEVLFSNMRARARGITLMNDADLRAESHVKTLFGQWITNEANRLDLPVLEARPWETLKTRVITTLRM